MLEMSAEGNLDNLEHELSRDEEPVSSAGGPFGRRRGSRISDLGRRLAQNIRDLYASGARMWTKEMFLKIEEELAKEPLPESVMVRSMNGDMVDIMIPNPNEYGHAEKGAYQYIIHFKKYQDLVYRAESYEDDDYDDISDQMKYTSCALNIRWQTNEPSPRLEYPEVKADWDEAWQNWIQSPACKELTQLFTDNAKLLNTTERIVCFGLGDLDRRPDGIAECDDLPLHRCIYQHAVALSLSTLFGKLLGRHPLPIIVQDPDYSPATKELFNELGIEVVDGLGSLAFTHVNDETLVISCAPNIPVKQVVADIAKPSVMIWDRVQPIEEERNEWTVKIEDGRESWISPWLTDQDSPRTRELIEEYHNFDFPPQRERFGSMTVYIRKD